MSKIESKLNEIGFKGESLIMQSNGGVLTFKAAKFKPVFMVESGPAAGVIASTYIGNNLGFKCIIVMPSNMSTERKTMLKSFGAELIEVPAGDFRVSFSHALDLLWVLSNAHLLNEGILRFFI